MCRFVLYLGEPLALDLLITRPAHSLVHQSYESHEMRHPLNGDGFGVAWYVPGLSPRPGRFRAISPAWSNENLAHLCRVTESSCILAHVRAASPGLPVVQTNCHPFVADRHAFMHNGLLGSFRALRRRLIGKLSRESYDVIHGSTDSEHLFALFLDARRRLGGDGGRALGRALVATVHEAIALSEEVDPAAPSHLNLAVTDGSSAAVTRFALRAEAPSLYLHRGGRYTLVDEQCVMAAAEPGRRAALVSSERLSEDPGWEAVPAQHVVMIESDASVAVEPLSEL